MENIVNRLRHIGIVPVVAIEDEKDAVSLCQAMTKGGINCAEITFRTAAAKNAIALIKKEIPEMLVAAGTVLTKQQADDAIEAGCDLIVAPGLDPELVRYIQSRNMPVMPGISTPSEAGMALSLGLEYVKLFPAEVVGGLKMIKALSGPFPTLKFMPTGGISLNNVREYLRNPRVICAGGSWLCETALIREGKFDEIEKRCAEASAIVREEGR